MEGGGGGGTRGDEALKNCHVITCCLIVLNSGCPRPIRALNIVGAIPFCSYNIIHVVLVSMRKWPIP